MLHKILTGRFTGVPIFATIMMLVFYMTFNVFGKFLSEALTVIIDKAVTSLDIALVNIGAGRILHALIIDGICAGVGSVLSFVPIIGVLFFFLSLLEETGYLPNVAAMLDRPMMKIGLSGRCVVPLVMGFGCNVPAILAAGSIFPYRQRIRTIFMIPFMSCSAKLPIYSMLTAAFFRENRVWIMAAVYSAGILTAIIYAVIFKFLSGIHRGAPPYGSLQRYHKSSSYKIPSFKTIAGVVFDNVSGFIRKAFTVIFAASVIIWALQSFNCDLHPVSDGSESILASMGRCISPVFAPIGFGEWQAASAIIAGISAKEAVVSTFAVLSQSAQGGSSFDLLIQIFSPAGAFSFMIFCLLYIPCIATLTAVKKQTGSWKYSLIMVILQLIYAWCFSFIVYQISANIYILFI